MNEYLIEDEYSYYEIDPECRIGFADGKRADHKLGKTNHREEKTEGNYPFVFSDSSLWLLFLIWCKRFRQTGGPGLQKSPDKKH